MTEALKLASELLSAGWTFISTNDILFGVCALSLLSGAIYTVKNLF